MPPTHPFGSLFPTQTEQLDKVEFMEGALTGKPTIPRLQKVYHIGEFLILMVVIMHPTQLTC